MRKEFILTAFPLAVATPIACYYYPPLRYALWVLIPLFYMGFVDFFQKRHTIRRNFPILGRFRYIFEAIRPEINQYFVESNTDGRPFSREQRSVVYQRSKKQLDTLPFGTQFDVYDSGYEWVNHSITPVDVDPISLRVKVGSEQCRQPYVASIFNISAMSYGALSHNAIEALNGGAKDGNFAHNTGEGSISIYHERPGGDLIWQIGTGYFGCRDENGKFNPHTFEERSKKSAVKMIEIKLSQGAKPGHGGILPAAKVTEEIAKIRDVPVGQDVLSPPGHSAFSTPIEMMEFIQQLRDLSGGKPIGFKLCVGKRREFLSICKAIEKTGILPDFIAVDGGEGGTGAAPVEFSNHLGSPGVEGLQFIHNCLVGYGLRDQIKILSSGKITTAFGMIKKFALGADIAYSARGMMLALGCIQALRCNANVCPAGVATQDPFLSAGLVVKSKRKRVHDYHEESIHAVAHLIGAMGLNHTHELRPWHIVRRINQSEVKHYGEIFDYITEGSLKSDHLPPGYKRAVEAASPETFGHAGSPSIRN